MTRQEYEAKYGTPPSVPAASTSPKPAPIKMTRAEYDAKYGEKKRSLGTTVKNTALGLLTGGPTAAINAAVAPAAIDRATESFGSDVKKRFANVKEAYARQDAGEQGYYQTGEDIAANAAGLVGDVGGTVAMGLGKMLLPKVAENKIAEGAQKVFGSAPVQKVVEKYGDFKEENPKLARKIENIGNLGSLIPIGAGAKSVAKGTEEAVEVAAKTTSKIAKPVTEAVGSTGKKYGFDKKAGDIMQRVARISKDKQAKFEQTAGESVGDYLKNRGIFGNVDEITTKLYNRFSKSKNVADDALASLPGTYKPQPVKTALEELAGRETRVSTPGAPSRDLSRVQELAKKLEGDGLSMSEINEVKRLYEKNVKLDFIRQNLPESVARANNIDAALREWQFKQADELGLENLPDINKETRLAKQLMDDLGREYAGSAGNNAVTLTDYILLAGGDPTAIGLFLTKKTFGSKKIMSAIAKRLAKSPKIGEPGAKRGLGQLRLPAPKAKNYSDPTISLPGELKTTFEPAAQLNLRNK